MNKFDKVFNRVMKKYDIPANKWYELFDSSLFDEVEKKCRKYLKTPEDVYNYDCWIRDMEEDL